MKQASASEKPVMNWGFSCGNESNLFVFVFFGGGPGTPKRVFFIIFAPHPPPLQPPPALPGSSASRKERSFMYKIYKTYKYIYLSDGGAQGGGESD